MHQLVALYLSWSATLYAWARIAVGILLWFWVVSGAIFALRFVAFMLMNRNGGSSALAAASTPIPFPLEPFENQGRHDSSSE